MNCIFYQIACINSKCIFVSAEQFECASALLDSGLDSHSRIFSWGGRELRQGNRGAMICFFIQVALAAVVYEIDQAVGALLVARGSLPLWQQILWDGLGQFNHHKLHKGDPESKTFGTWACKHTSSTSVDPNVIITLTSALTRVS